MQAIRTRHGDSGKRLHYVWKAMRQRCYNPNNKDYPNYGGRGISVCKKWSSYLEFKKWALENGYRKGLTLERKDVNSNYSPKNCTWILNEFQALNTRKLATLTYKGKTRTLIEWSEITGIGVKTLKGRIVRGWSPYRTLTVEPVIGRNQYG